MKSSVRVALGGRYISSVTARSFTSNNRLFQPTALHRAEAAADRKAHPESQLTQEKLEDKKHSHHWEEANATPSEADIKADRETRDAAAARKQENIKDQK